MSYKKIDDITFSISGRVHKRDSELGSYAYVDCNQCKGYCPGYMLKTPIWNQARQGQYDFLCLICVEKNIGRPVRYEDFTDAPINLGFWGFDKRDLPDAPKNDLHDHQRAIIGMFHKVDKSVLYIGDPVDFNGKGGT